MYIYTSYCKLNMERIYKPYSTPQKKGNPREILVFTYSHPSYQSSPKKKTSFRVAFQPVATSIIQDALCEEHRDEKHRKLKGMEI